VNKPIFTHVAAMLALWAALTGCSTTGRENMPDSALTIAPFAPAAAKAPIQWVEGRYPNLFAESSYAVWPMSPGMEEIGGIEDPYLDIECLIASEFADSSIAYDLAGLRGVNVYLITPDGTQVRPIQIQRGTELTEEPRGALRYFARTNHAVFPLRALDLAVLTGAGPQSVRLVLEAHGAVYQFEWPSSTAGNTGPTPPPPEKEKHSAREAWQRARDVAHTFD